ncbi:MAG TPA: peptidase [Cytophagales bacterium]|jgi:glutaminyl-peptide cyclotransferase|nr:peptidase [Cytophagales bacterium]
MKQFYSLLLYISFVVLGGCSPESKKVDTSRSIKVQHSITVPSFNSDSAYNFIQKQVDFGPRVPNTAAHHQCGDYLVKQLKSYGANVEQQVFNETAYDGTLLQLRNIIASYNSENPKRILLAAHWDTRPYADKDTVDRDEPILGANDGASGVAVLLEIARNFASNKKPEVGVDLILFDGEDYGEHEDIDQPPLKNGRMQIWWCLGSQYWAKNPHEPGYNAYYGILLDMVGGKNARFYQEGGSMQYAPKVVKKVWKKARDLGYDGYFIRENSPGIMDDHIFVNRDAKIPMINIVEYDPNSKHYYFGNYHHTHQDDMDIIDKYTLQAVGETLLYLLYHE